MSTSGSNQRIRLILTPLLADEIRDFLIDRQARGLSSKTVSWYSEKLGIAEAFFTDYGVVGTIELRATHVRAFLIELAETHNPGGVHGIYRALKAFLNWWEAEVEPENWSNPMRKVPPPRVNVPPLEPVSLDDLRAMLATCEPRTFYGDRNRAIMMFLLDSGCRRAEFQTLDVGDVDLRTGSVLIVRGKGGKSRTTFVGTKTRRALTKHLRWRLDTHNSDPLWVTQEGTRIGYAGLREIVRRRAEQAGVEEPGLHSFRRGFAICALRSGCDLITLQRMLGHSSLAVVSRYLKQIDGDLLAAHQKVGPVDHLL